MQAVAPIDLVSLIATIMGISIVLIPVMGLTARFALKPVVEAFANLFEARSVEESVRILERRMSLMESQIESIDNSVNRLLEVSEFHAKLSAGSRSGDGDGETS